MYNGDKMDDWGGGFGSFNREPSRREQLEIDYDGKTTAEKNKLKEEKQKQDMEAMRNGSYGSGSYGNMSGKPSFRDKFRNPTSRYGGSEGSWGHVLLALLIVFGIIYLVYVSMTTGLTGVWRTFNASPQENFGTFTNAILKVQEDNVRLDNTDKENEQGAVYLQNKIYNGEDIRNQPYPEYIVYVYTESEEDKPFNEYVNKVESGEIELSIPIYKLYYNEVKDMDVNAVLEFGEPGFVFFKEPIDGTKLYDSVLTDPTMFDKIVSYSAALVAERDENLKNNNR